MKSRLSCSVAQDLLPQYAEKLLSPESEAELKAHLEECPACREIYTAMTSPEPELTEAAVEVDYLKKIRKSRRRLLICCLAALILVASGFLFYLQYQRKQAAVSYDEASKTVVVYGNDAKTEIVLPSEIDEAVYLDAQFDSFHVSAYLPYLRSGDLPLEAYLPQYLDRTEASLKFIRSYLEENSSDQYPVQRASKYVDLTIRENEEYRWSELKDRISLEVGSYFWHREEVYILSLLGSKNVQWKQLGYAWFLGSCIDPYSELLVRSNFDSIEELPYAAFYTRAGGTAELTPENYRKLNDAVSCLCLTKGMYWGTAYESYPLRWTALYKASQNSDDPGNMMSVCMATSFIAWLSDHYGFDRVSRFCFDRATFEEAFASDYSSAYEEWSAWILDRCGGI